MQRVHSDVSEYDAQGNLTKRTITTSYTSLADAAAASRQRQRSSPDPQARRLSFLPRTASAGSNLAADSMPVKSHFWVPPGLCCPYCLESRESPFPSRADLTDHVCAVHSDILVPASRARKYHKLKGAYRKRTKQLLEALQLLKANVAERLEESETKRSNHTDWIEQTMQSLSMESNLSSSEDSEDGGPDNTHFSPKAFPSQQDKIMDDEPS
jgi:hypothetical protein